MDAKTQKYDRQLRLWGGNGQEALESAHILLVNASPVGCEVLKNLILPGIGQFTIVDAGTVALHDVGSNFFFDLESVGKSRAEKACEFLSELNEDAKGHWIKNDISTLLKEKPDFLDQFTIVMVSEVTQELATKIAKICWDHGKTTQAKKQISFVWVRTVGLIGAARIVTPEHTIVETHPDSVADLRIDSPFPELDAYWRTFDFDTQDNLEFGHIPYVAILLKFMDQWKKEHNGQTPSTYAEKNQLKALIRSGMRSADDENFEEALSSVLRSCQATVVPSSIKDLFSDPEVENLTAESIDFWVLVKALKEFVADTSKSAGLLPLSGTIPDMKAQTDSYVKLQSIYKAKAKQDAQVVAEITGRVLEKIGRPKNSIAFVDIEAFCKFSAFLKVVRHRSLESEYVEPKTEQIALHLADPDSVFVQYVLLRASDAFYGDHGRYPGENESWEEDVEHLQGNVATLLESWGVDKEAVSPERVHEICRYGMGAIHNIASLMGGVVSQEIIKVITRQYVPMNNTVLFDGAASVTGVFEL
ncbi:NEDD8-activating enzyme E1 regulatory subunit [Actinomortierella ambigua]|uniref:NEDD8-activating enzyme E1 regulatory subunit n=1 Tax=Actinomortierella ambigua TaxID=1343610 RepID=A0A9P6QFA8_9FUNG|nr:NEDD8-activating enzyme E1 regulatory subunit [Actinomortierella ambigua]